MLQQSCPEGRLCRRELEEASLTIMQVSIICPMHTASQCSPMTYLNRTHCDNAETHTRYVQMDAKIRLLSSVTAQSQEKVDIRIARERVMMHQALDRMRAHMSEVLDAQVPAPPQDASFTHRLGASFELLCA